MGCGVAWSDQVAPSCTLCPDLLAGLGGFCWPANATLVAGFSGEVPEPLQPVLRNLLKWGASAVN